MWKASPLYDWMIPYNLNDTLPSEEMTTPFHQDWLDLLLLQLFCYRDLLLLLPPLMDTIFTSTAIIELLIYVIFSHNMDSESNSVPIKLVCKV